MTTKVYGKECHQSIKSVHDAHCTKPTLFRLQKAATECSVSTYLLGIVDTGM